MASTHLEPFCQSQSWITNFLYKHRKRNSFSAKGILTEFLYRVLSWPKNTFPSLPGCVENLPSSSTTFSPIPSFDSSLFHSDFLYLLLPSHSVCTEVFPTLGDRPKKSVNLHGDFLLFVFNFVPLSSTCCCQKPKSPGYFTLSCLHNYNFLITQTLLGLQHSLNNRASGITYVPTRQPHHRKEAGWEENTKRRNEVIGWKQRENNTAGFTL